MAIIWNSAMSVANDHVDHDHHFMINLVNTIELLLQKPEEKDNLLLVFDHLHDYSVNHFRREESIQRKIGYPKTIIHKNSHSKLLNELVVLKEELDEVKTSKELGNKSDEIVQFLRKWLINHVLDEDLLLKPYLEKHPRGFY